MIVGVVTTAAVVRYAPLILWEFGPRIFGRCVWAIMTGAQTTFLNLLF